MMCVPCAQVLDIRMLPLDFAKDTLLIFSILEETGHGTTSLGSSVYHARYVYVEGATTSKRSHDPTTGLHVAVPVALVEDRREHRAGYDYTHAFASVKSRHLIPPLRKSCIQLEVSE